MTATLDLKIYAGQTFSQLLEVADLVTSNRGLRCHIREATSAATVIAILTRNGDANAALEFTGATGITMTIGASISGAWLVGADRVEWVYDVESYDLTDADDVIVTHRGKAIVYGNRTRPEDITPSEQMPSGDGRYTRFDGEQGLSPEQQLQAQLNILGEAYTTGGGVSDHGALSGLSDDDHTQYHNDTRGDARYSQLGHNHSGTYDPAGTAAAAVSAHAGATDPHGDRAYADSGLALKAPVNSPTFTGVPAAPTASGGTNTTQIATTAFVTSAVASAVAGLLEFVGSVDASTNPNYSAASKGDSYLISVAGKIGGASGKSVDVGDLVVASADNAGGAEASVGTSWFVLEHNLAGALLTANALSELTGVAATARSNIGAQSELVSGTNIKTINSTSLLGSGDIAISASPGGSSGQGQYNSAGSFDGMPLWRTDANTLSQHNSTTAQIYEIFNTRTDVSNYEKTKLGWASNIFVIDIAKAGTGTQRAFSIRSNGVEYAGMDTVGIFSISYLNITGQRIRFTANGLLERYTHSYQSTTTTSYTFVSSDYGYYWVETSGSDQAFTMMSAPVSGYWAAFKVSASKSSYLRITANTGQKIRLAGGVSASAGYVRSNAAGSFLYLIYDSIDSEWVAWQQAGTWTIDS